MLKGNARTSAFIGNSNARTFDLHPGDVMIYPSNCGHYIENKGTEDVVWIELYKSNVVEDISLTQWLALTPPEIVSQVLKVPMDFVSGLKKERQVIIA